MESPSDDPNWEIVKAIGVLIKANILRFEGESLPNGGVREHLAIVPKAERNGPANL